MPVPSTRRGETDNHQEFVQLRGPWRAAFALALHISFVAFPALLVLGLFGVAAVTYHYEPSGGLRVAAAAVVVAVPIGFGMRAVLRPRIRPRGLSMGRKAQPQLWRMADVLASALRARAPDEIRIVPEPVAQLRLDTSLLGLRVRRRYLQVGLPLLAGLSVGELRAVVASELGRAAGGSKLTGIAYRARISVQRTDSELLAGPVKWIFGGYARLFTALTGVIESRAARAADTAAVLIAGKRTAMVALRRLTAIELGWDEYTEHYLKMATTVGNAPEILLGFRSFLDDQRRKKELARRSKQLIEQDRPVDGHAGLRVRLERMKRLPDTERKPDERPAFALLRNPKQTVPELEERLLVNGFGSRLQWDEMARKANASHVAECAGRLVSAVRHSGLEVEPTIGGVLAAVHQGQAADLINPALDPALDPEQVSQAVVDTLTELLAAAVVDALICAGRAHHELDWGGPSTVRLATGRTLDPDRLVRPAVTDPRLVPGLHRALVELGVPLQHTRPPAVEPEPTLVSLASAVRCAGELHDLLITDRGLLLIPTCCGPVRRLLGGVFHSSRAAVLGELDELAATPIGKLRQHPAAQWVDNRDVATARLLERRSGWSLTLELYLDDFAMSSLDEDCLRRGRDDTASMRLSSTIDTEELHDPCGTFAELMGARMQRGDRGSGGRAAAA